MRHNLLLLLLLLIHNSGHAEGAIKAPYVGTSLKGSPCAGAQGYGPYDYSKRHSISPEHLALVEGAHFKPDVELLLEQKHRSDDISPWPDLDYTLRAWPNHHRALLSIIRFQLSINNNITKLKNPQPAECYLQRAINFSPEDPAPYALYGFYLRELGKLADAEKYYQVALKLDPNNPKFAYSYSLLLIDQKEYDSAYEYAKIAYKNGTPPASLKNKLTTLGIWK